MLTSEYLRKQIEQGNKYFCQITSETIGIGLVEDLIKEVKRVGDVPIAVEEKVLVSFPRKTYIIENKIDTMLIEKQLAGYENITFRQRPDDTVDVDGLLQYRMAHMKEKKSNFVLVDRVDEVDFLNESGNLLETAIFTKGLVA